MGLITNNLENDLVALSQAGSLRAAFEELMRALDYANHLDRSAWEFAVDLPWLRRLNLSNNDLRWMVTTGLIDHAIEETATEESGRNFRRPPKLIFCRKSCFVLTAKGVEIGREVVQSRSHEDLCASFQRDSAPAVLAGAAAETLPVPCWDRVQQELKVGTVLVKRFRVPAASQEAILAAFEEESWPPRIDDPLPPKRDQSPKRRLQETIKSLNRNQKEPLIRFLGDGNARGVLWKYCDVTDTCHTPSRFRLPFENLF